MHCIDTVHRTCAPFAYVLPGENICEAVARHRRQTGHRGTIVIAGFASDHGSVNHHAA